MIEASRQQRLKGLARNIILYGVIGCLSAGVDTLTFTFLYYVANISWEIANCCSVVIGICISYSLNRKYNFKVFDHPVMRAAIFFGVGMCGLLLSQAVLGLGVLISADMFSAKLVSVVIVAVFQFLLNKLVSFGIRF